jgi:hypothetical protein
MTVTNNKKLPVTDFEKQSQTNPIQSQNLIAVRGAKPKQTQFMVSLSNHRTQF